MRRWILVIYVLIGLIVGWERHYITLAVVKVVFSALLAVILWWLVLIGVNLHLH